MKLRKIIRDDSFVFYSHEVKGPVIEANDPDKPGKTIKHQGLEEVEVTAHEAPLKSFDKAMQALASVAAKVLGCPPEWTDKIRVKSLAVSYTAKGTRSAVIVFTKELAATDLPHRMSTPSFRFDDAAEGEDGRRQVAPRHAELLDAMMTEAEKYADGKRQQMTLPLDDGKKAADKLDKEELTAPLKFSPTASGD